MIKSKAGIGIIHLPIAGQLLSLKLLQATARHKEPEGRMLVLFFGSKQRSLLTVVPVLSCLLCVYGGRTLEGLSDCSGSTV